MRNLIVCLTICLTIYSCKLSKYYGYVYDFDKEIPLEKVMVYDSLNGMKTFTDKKGYFEIEKGSKTTRALIFTKEDYCEKIISTISIQSGEFMEEKFKGEKIFLSHKTTCITDSLNLKEW